MYEHQLKDMVNLLVKNGQVSEENSEAALKTLQDYWEDKIAVTWTAEDVIGYAKQRGTEISEERAKEILQEMLHRHDCTIGITWDVIACYIN